MLRPANVQGRDATAALGDHLQHLGLLGPVLVMAGASVRGQLEATWAVTFDAAGLTHAVRTFGGECS